MKTATELIEAAEERGYTFESMGSGKASQYDLTHYILEIFDETQKAQPTDCYDGTAVAVALFRIWDEH